MKKLNHLILLIIIILSFSFSNSLNAQNKISSRLQNKMLNEKSEKHIVWIFFTDKGNNINEKLALTKQKLPQNSIKRRTKSMKNRSIVTFNDIPVNTEYVEKLNIKSENFRHKSAWLNAVSANLSENKIKEIEKLSFVKKIDVVNVFRKNNLQTTKNLISQTNSRVEQRNNYNYGNSFTQMQQINVPTAHDLGFSGNGVKICILDAGYNNLEHPAFSSLNVLGTYDFVNNDENVDDQDDDHGIGDHGTNTLSAIAGFDEGELIGSAFGASYILAKTENTETETTAEEDNWVAAMEWAETNFGPDVSTSSLGYPDFYEPNELDGNTATITIAADYAASIGILVVNSAGNSGDGTTTISAPADGDSVLTVGAVDSLGVKAGFSSVGPTADGRIKPDIMAMGEAVVVAEEAGVGYRRANGTSFSCPIAAGVGALLIEMVPEATNMEIFEALRQTANNSETPNNQYGMGLIDVMKAYNYLIPQIWTDTLPDTEDNLTPITINAVVTSYYDLKTNTPTLHYKFNDNEWETVIMQNNGENLYSADIPTNGQNGTYKYYISAENIHRTVTLPTNAPTDYFTFTVGTDNTKPVITHNNIKEYYKNLWQQASIICSITDNAGVDIQNSKVEWKINNVLQEPLSFSKQSENVYKAIFNNNDVQVGDLIEYRIVAEDVAQTPNTAILPETGYYEFNIVDNISFEQNEFSHNWEFSGQLPWIIVETGAEGSMYSAKSGDIENDESSNMSINIKTIEDGQVEFFRKVSTEKQFDLLNFYIDGVEKGSWHGVSDWEKETYDLSAGEHLLEWKYEKDSFISHNEDCAWIDIISLPEVESVVNQEVIDKSEFKIFPNPVTNILNINFESSIDNFKCTIYNINGQKIKTENNNLQINVSELTNGIYFLQIETKTGILTSKFVVNK